MLALPLDSANRATSSQCRPQRSPNRGEASSRSTTFLNASAELSAMNAVDLLGRRGQPGQVEADPADQRGPLGVGDGLEPLGLESGEQEAVDIGPGPGRVFDRRRFHHLRRLERPELPRLLQIDGPLAAGFVAELPRGSGAPILTQSSKSATTASGSWPFGGI